MCVESAWCYSKWGYWCVYAILPTRGGNIVSMVYEVGTTLNWCLILCNIELLCSC